MRKRQISQAPGADVDEAIDIERLAVVEVTSEDEEHPVEAALLPGDETGWIAAAPGPQIIRLLFDEPHLVNRVRLVFHEHALSRTQEFVVRVLEEGSNGYREIVRQQYTFSPTQTVEEVEEFVVGTTVGGLEVSIVPDIAGGPARASLQSVRLS